MSAQTGVGTTPTTLVNVVTSGVRRLLATGFFTAACAGAAAGPRAVVSEIAADDSPRPGANAAAR